MGHLADIDGFAAPDKGARIDCLQFLLDLPGDGRARTFGQCTELGEGIRRCNSMGVRAGFDPNQDGAFRLFY